jgi:hypothetical protein
MMNGPKVRAWCFGLVALAPVLGCGPSEPNELDKLGTVRMTIKGQAFELWIADEWDEQLKGLMHVTAQQMAPLADGTQRGMIFVFNGEQTNSFWMKDTIIPLDIAYIGTDRKVVKIHTMAPLDTRPNQYPPGKPYRYTIELNAGVCGDIGMAAGDEVDIPAKLRRGSR